MFLTSKILYTKVLCVRIGSVFYWEMHTCMVDNLKSESIILFIFVFFGAQQSVQSIHLNKGSQDLCCCGNESESVLFRKIFIFLSSLSPLKIYVLIPTPTSLRI